MAVKPTKPTVPPAPSRANPGSDFSLKADAHAAFLGPHVDYMNATNDFVDQRADDALAAAIGGTLPPITSKAGQYIRVNNAGTAVEFGPLADQENRIINGAFDFWQRGASQTTVGYGSVDRWRNAFLTGSVTMSRQEFATGEMLGSNSPTYFLRQTVSGLTLASDNARAMQHIEGVRSYAGQTITVLGWARRSSGSGNMAISATQVFGTGGAPSAVVDVPGQLVTLTADWQPFAVSLAIPSVSGKTLGTAGDDYLRVAVWTAAGSNFASQSASIGLQTIGIDLWGIHIRIGTHTTAACAAYRAPEFAAELARCQRYYETGPVFMTAYQGAASGFGYARPIYPKRVPPAVTFSGVSYINASGLTAQSVGTSHVTVTAAATAAGPVNFSATAAFDAEL